MVNKMNNSASLESLNRDEKNYGKKVKLDGPIKRLYIDARMDNPWPKEIQL